VHQDGPDRGASGRPLSPIHFNFVVDMIVILIVRSK
jgi:hypothetical protein